MQNRWLVCLVLMELCLAIGAGTSTDHTYDRGRLPYVVVLPHRIKLVCFPPFRLEGAEFSFPDHLRTVAATRRIKNNKKSSKKL